MGAGSYNRNGYDPYGPYGDQYGYDQGVYRSNNQGFLDGLNIVSWISMLQDAKYLEILDLPDDMRELLDEYMDANSRADQQKSCEEFFTCPYSIKDSMKRNVADTNNL